MGKLAAVIRTEGRGGPAKMLGYTNVQVLNFAKGECIGHA
jgi:hypothetical protein